MGRKIFVLAVAILAIASLLYSQNARVETVGPAEDGSFLLSSGWRIRPAGTNIPLSTLPMSHALAPSGRILAVLNGGYARASVSLIDLETSPGSRPRSHRRWLARVGLLASRRQTLCR